MPYKYLLFLLISLSHLFLLQSEELKKKNILMIVVDDLNHWVGYTKRNPQIKTPNIDRLSKMGLSFTNAHSPSTTCKPARSAIFSGLRPSSSACYSNKDKWNRDVGEGYTMNVALKKAGYNIYKAGKLHTIGKWNDPMETVWDEQQKRIANENVNPTRDDGYYGPNSLDMKDEDLADWHTVNFCIDKLNEKHDKPFFLGCGLIKPHLPLAVPQKYYKMFPLDKIELPPYQKNDLEDIPEAGRYIGSVGEHEKMLELNQWKGAIQAYMATIAYVDGCIGRLLDAFEASPYKDNTMVVLWGDHGWHLGEKNKWRKATLWEESTRVPLIWSIPGMTQPGSFCDQPVDLQSLYRTIFELNGLKVPGHVEGDSIVPLLKNPTATWNGIALTTYGYNNHSIRTNDWRYIRYHTGEEELYNHNNDSFEWNNLASNPEYAEVKAKLKLHLPKKNLKGTVLPNMKRISKQLNLNK